MIYTIKLHWDECAWVARFDTSGGPDVTTQAPTPDEALKRLGYQIRVEIDFAGGIDKIPMLTKEA